MKEIYVCTVCGYETEGPLPEGFRCPVCGVDASHFVIKEKPEPETENPCPTCSGTEEVE